MLKHPEVLEAAVVGAEEASGLIKTFAFVVPRDGAADAEGLAAELRQRAESSLPTHQRPREIRIVRALPRTDTGKLQRFRLKEAAESRR
jgi:benzoate-CoA ligase